MIELTNVNNWDWIKTLMKDPKLFKVSWPDEDINTWEPNKSMTWFILHDDDNIYGCLEIKEFTRITAEVHIHILSNWWGKNVSDDIKDAICNQLRNKTGVKNLLTMSPSNINHMEPVLLRWGFKQQGTIENCVIWDGEMADFKIFVKDLYGEE